MKFQLQFNRNSFNPKSNADWKESFSADSRKSCADFLKATRKQFKHVFGYPSDVQYRIKQIG